MAWEQLPEAGVYIDVFEQSILEEKSTKRPLSFVASLSAELVVVSVLVIIPLTYSDHLPEFHLNRVLVAPPLRPPTVDVAPLERSSAGGMRVPVQRRHFEFAPIASNRSVPQVAGISTFDAPSLPGLDNGPTGLNGNAVINIAGRTIITPPPHRPESAATPAVRPTGPIRVSQGVQMAKLVKRVIPQYPPLARMSRISGVVHLIGIIARDGSIRNLELINGHPLLTRAALDAVQQWIFKPTLLNGEPVEVIAPIDVNFTLGQ